MSNVEYKIPVWPNNATGGGGGGLGAKAKPNLTDILKIGHVLWDNDGESGSSGVDKVDIVAV